MTSRIILLDLDGPLADLEGAFLKAWKEKYPEEFFIPFEQRRKFFMNDEYPEHLREKVADIIATAGFFADLPVVPGSIEAVQEIIGIGHTVVLCTSDIFGNPTGLADKRTWVCKHLGDTLAKTMIFTRDKTLIRGDFLIDDKPEITGLLTPAWEHIVFDQPFNRDVSDKKRIRMDWSDWRDILP